MRPPPSTRRLLVGLLGPPLAWALHLGLLYPLVLLACELGTEVILHAVTVVAVAITLGLGASSILALRRLPPPEAEGDRFAQARFLTRAGVFSAGLFLAVIVVESLPAFLQDPCA